MIFAVEEKSGFWLLFIQLKSVRNYFNKKNEFGLLSYEVNVLELESNEQFFR